jgi:O-antigen ligase
MDYSSASEGTTAYKDRIEAIFSALSEYGIYLFAFLFFFDKGEGLRNLGLYGALASWLVLAVAKRNVRFSLDLPTCAFLACLGSVLISSVLSLNPLYSIAALDKDILKGTILFLVISTRFDLKMLLRLGRVFSAAGIVLLVLGLHGFLTGESGFYTPENMFSYIDKNKFGFFIGFIFPFFVLYTVGGASPWQRGIWGTFSFWGLTASVLSASRGAMGAVFVAIPVYAAFLLKRRYLKASLLSVAVLAALAVSTFGIWPEPVRKQILSTGSHIWTVHSRTHLFWKPALESVRQRPILGWGYGKMIYRDPRPFQDTSKPGKDHKGGLHSTYISVLFHQGVVGLMTYLFLIFSMCHVLMKTIRGKSGPLRLLAVTLLCIVLGSFILHALVRVNYFRVLALTAGMVTALNKEGADG